MTEPVARPEVVETAPRRFRKEGLGFVYEPKDADVRLSVDYLRRRSDEVSGEVRVESLNGTLKHIHQARYNLSGPEARRKLPAMLEQLTGGVLSTSTSQGWVEAFFTAVLRNMDRGEAFTSVGQMARAARRPDTIARLAQAGEINLWYGPHGAAKGWLATHAAISHNLGLPLCGFAVQQGRTLYLDWETHQDTLDERIKIVARGLGIDPPEVFYRRCAGTLPRQINTVARFVSENGITLVILDSLGHAFGSPGEYGSYESVAIDGFEAIRYLAPATILGIDHLSGDGVGAAGVVGKAIGSIRKMADARVAWEIRREQDVDGSDVHVGLYHTKYNNTPRYPSLGIRLSFETDQDGHTLAVRFKREDLRDSAELSGRMSLLERMDAALSGRAMQPAELAKEIEEPANKVRAMLHKYQEKRFQALQDGRWARALRPDQPTPLRPLRPVEEAPRLPYATDDVSDVEVDDDGIPF